MPAEEILVNSTNPACNMMMSIIMAWVAKVHGNTQKFGEYLQNARVVS